MKWSPQQAEALDRVAQWMRDRDRPFFYLAGYAGTGKTSLAKHFAEGVGGSVVYGSFTGKAASVMREKGCEGATTIHRLIYTPSAKGSTRLRELREQLEKEADDTKKIVLRTQIQEEVRKLKAPNFALKEDADIRHAKLVVIDECSMVGRQMGHDLLSFNVPVLVLGDPAQLPPVGTAEFFTKGDPDFMLTEVHRQARESGILRLATQIREGEGAPYCDYGDARVIRKGELNPDDVPGYDQVIVGRRRTRHATNDRMRELLGRTSPLPELGDKLLCLRNNHDMGLLNGEVYTAASDASPWESETVRMAIESDAGMTQQVQAWRAPFLGQELENWSRNNDIQEFGYGYVMTCHKAQGSQYRDVIVFDESRFFRGNEVRWLYTAVTRASKEVVIVR